ncbi:MAG TPA: alkaline phosphatase family protein [Verrucomicrobiae bacterium]|nr:alkaline phosphatase family protein [Verrucomicrobiae bacterium]
MSRMTLTTLLSKFISGLVMTLLALAAPVFAQPLPGKARLNLVFVLDGLRPDSINPEDTPSLFKLRQEGVNYLNGHSVFPTVTRVNAAAMATGTYPGKNGIVGNTLYVSKVNPNRAFNNDDYKNLLKLHEVTEGNMVLVKSLGELLHARGFKLGAVSSGSSGQALLLNPRAPKGVGILVNGDLEPGALVAYPPNVNSEVLSRFGPAPRKGGQKDSYNASVNWTQEVLREYVIPQLQPDVILNWITEPDHMQHAFGAGSPEARRSIQNADRQVGLVLKKLETAGLSDRTNIFVVSDHGFELNVFGVNVTQELIKGGLKASPDSDDVVIASSGQVVLLHVKGRDTERIKQIVKFLQSQSWSGVVFTAVSQSDHEKVRGWVDGTFSLDLIHMSHTERGPDIVLTFPWSSAKNAFGIQGANYTNTGAATGPFTGQASGHGSMSPWSVNNTFIAWGMDFKRGVTLRVPASNVDVSPTLLALKGINDAKGLDGRVLLEALIGGPDEEQIPIETRIFTTETAAGYKATIQVTNLGSQRYIDKSWRVR